MQKKFLNEKSGLQGVITIRAYKAGTKELIKKIVQHNLIMAAPNVGKDLIIQKLIASFTGVDPFSLHINYGAIGTGQISPSVTDTQLTAETNRTTVSMAEDSSNTIAILQFFFPDTSLLNQTYYEFGTFVDGTNGANTGQLFNHALFSTPYVKAAGQDTTIEVDISL